ncbi:MAG: bifunctional folylpolyglutamate synthase/dihydrofolate synthase [Actinobacteria bacterium]|nr:bifunctional folylpolyglutamate synthase/dihydrofolate synthase [Actinomycetota bacterium]
MPLPPERLPAGFDPDAYLDSLEPVGWRLGLERMWKLTTALGLPQRRFASVHVVGTNGKSSVTRMVAALLEAHGVPAGACLSPHTTRWTERTLIRGEEIAPAAWAEAVAQVAAAAAGVNRTLEDGEVVTEFEAATAATFVALARARVKAAAIEAGLGGRLDATNTIPSRVTVLTSVGRDHTEWLGESELEIAAEKLAVLKDQSTLVLGRVSAPVRELAERTAGERGATVVVAPEDPGAGVKLAATGAFQRRNFALATAAARAFLGEVDPERVAAVAAGIRIPGRLELVGESPPIYVDAAHNPDGAAALAEALPGIADGRPVVACLAILADKDAPAMIAALAPALRSVVCTEIPPAALLGHGRPGAHSRPAGELADLCRANGLEATPEPDLEAALRHAAELARAADAGVLLVTGSHYLIGPAVAAGGARG